VLSLGVLYVFAVLWGTYGVAVAIAGMLAFDLLFIPLRYSLTIEDRSGERVLVVDDAPQFLRAADEPPRRRVRGDDGDDGRGGTHRGGAAAARGDHPRPPPTRRARHRRVPRATEVDRSAVASRNGQARRLPASPRRSSRGCSPTPSELIVLGPNPGGTDDGAG